MYTVEARTGEKFVKLNTWTCEFGSERINDICFPKEERTHFII